MTDARLRGEWLTAPAHDGLTDAAYRVLHNALMHSAEQGTDGAIAMRELRFLYPGVLEPSLLDELERAGFWERTQAGYQLLGWSTDLGQSTAAEVSEYRQKARERQRKRRNAVRAAEQVTLSGEPLSDEVVTRDVTREVTRDVARDVGKARQGLSLPDDLTNTSASQSRHIAPRNVTDSDLSPTFARIASQHGITSVPAVMDALEKHTGHHVTAEQAVQVGLWILDKKPGQPPRAPQRYVTGAIARSPFEVQRHIHEAGGGS